MVSKAQRLVHAFAGILSIVFGATLLNSEGFAAVLSKSFLYPIGYWVFLPGLFIGGILLFLTSWRLHRVVYFVLAYLMIFGEVSLLWFSGFL